MKWYKIIGIGKNGTRRNGCTVIAHMLQRSKKEAIRVFCINDQDYEIFEIKTVPSPYKNLTTHL